MSTVKMDIANFNLTFGKDDKPMLENFLDLVLPAFSGGFERKVEDITYSFDRIEIINTEFGMALTGILVKDTIIDIFSKRDDKGNIVETNESYPSSPYSFFCIFLKNHRMIFVPNQKGSPSLSSFAPAARYALKNYKKIENSRRKKAKEPLLPAAKLNVVGIASRKKVEKELRKVEKINFINLRFYPLNGEDFEEISNASKTLLQNTRKAVEMLDGSTANTKINSPKNKNNVAILFEEVEGTAEPTLDVNYFNGQTGKIKNEKVVQRKKVDVSSDHIIDEQDKILEEAEKVDILSRVSSINDKIYNKYKDAISKLLK